MTEEAAADSTKLQKLIDGQGFGQLLTALASSASSQHGAAKNYRVANNKADLEIFSFCVASLHDDAPVVRTQSNSFASREVHINCNIREQLRKKPRFAISLTMVLIAMLREGEKDGLPLCASMIEALWDTPVPLVVYHAFPLLCRYALPTLQQMFGSGAVSTNDASHIRLFPLMQSIEQWDRIARAKLYDGHQLGTLLGRSERLLALKGLTDEEQHIVLLKLLHLIDCFEDDMTNGRKKLSTEDFVSIVDNLPPMRHYSLVLEALCDLLYTIPHSSFERSSSMLDGITRVYERFCILDGDADGSEFFKRLLTLAMVHVASAGTIDETVSFFSESVAPFLESHCGSTTHGTKGESLSIYSHVVEAIATAIETDFPTPQLLDRVLPFVFDSLAPYESSPLAHAIQIEALTYTIEVLRHFQGLPFIEEGFPLYSACTSALLNGTQQSSPEVFLGVIKLGNILLSSKDISWQGFQMFFLNQIAESLSALNGYDITFEERCVLATKALAMNSAVIESGVNRFKVFGIHFPLIFQKILSFDSNKNTLHKDLLNILADIVIKSARKGNNVEHLFSFVPTFLEIYSNIGETQTLKKSFQRLAEKFAFDSYMLLFDLGYGYKFCLSHFPSLPIEGIKAFTRLLILRGQREELRLFFQICVREFTKDRYEPLRQLLFSENCKYPDAVFRGSLHILETVIQLSKGEDQPNKEIVDVLSQSVLDKLAAVLSESIAASKKKTHSGATEIKKLREELQKILLYKTIFAEELARKTAALKQSAEPSQEEAEMADKLAEAESGKSTEEGALREEEASSAEQSKEEGSKLITLNAESVLKGFDRRFPAEVVSDATLMDVLLSIASRIDHVQHIRGTERYKHVHDLAVKYIKEFLGSNVPNIGGKPEQRLQIRTQYLEKLIYELESNQNIRQHLVEECGYSSELWRGNIYMAVEIELKNNVEENYHSALIGCFGEYVDILKSLNIAELQRGEEKIAVEAVINAALTVEELKRNRALCVTSITLSIECANKEKEKEGEGREVNAEVGGSILLRIKNLQRHEAILEEKYRREIQEQLNMPSAEMKRFFIRLNNTFIRTVSACGKNIVGCYAPDGDHAEKVLENGLKANAAFISIFEESKQAATPSSKHQKGKEKQDEDDEGADESPHTIIEGLGTEIENVEVLYTDSGMYVYKLYSNGHSYDTSLVWISLFRELILAQHVPAIILPRNFPNIRTFNLIREYVEPEIYSSDITFLDNFFGDGVESYYDHKTERIKPGDILLSSKNVGFLQFPELPNDLSQGQDKRRGLCHSSTRLEAASPREQTVAKVKRKKDFHATITSSVMKTLRNEESLRDYQALLNPFGRYISEYIEAFIKTGEMDESLLTFGFDIGTWNTNIKKKRQQQGGTPSDNVKMIDESEKQQFIQTIVAAIHRKFESYYPLSQEDLLALYSARRDHFLSLRVHLEALVRSWHPTPEKPEAERCARVREQLQFMRILILMPLRSREIHHMDSQQQEDFLRWAYRNEIRVWTHRGGMGNPLESLEEFLRLMSNENASKMGQTEAFPGLYVLMQEAEKADEKEDSEKKEPNVGKTKKIVAGENVVGYVLGEFVEKASYEVTMAWVDREFGYLNLAVEMYLYLFEELHTRGCEIVICDMLKGGFEKIISANVILRFLHRLQVHKLVLKKREDSYQLEDEPQANMHLNNHNNHNNNNNCEPAEPQAVIEQFEKIHLHLPTLMMGIRCYQFFTIGWGRKGRTPSTMVGKDAERQHLDATFRRGDREDKGGWVSVFGWTSCVTVVVVLGGAALGYVIGTTAKGNNCVVCKTNLSI